MFVGICNGTFNCTCAPGWEGTHCERKINYCHNITCENQGVCRPLFLNYSGRYCEIFSTKMIIFKIVLVSTQHVKKENDIVDKNERKNTNL
jgi:hypothetical protein